MLCAPREALANPSRSGRRYTGTRVALYCDELLHHDAMEAALDAVRSCVHPSLVDAALRKQANPRLRRLGLAAVVSSAGPNEGWTKEKCWTKERRARLDLYP